MNRILAMACAVLVHLNASAAGAQSDSVQILAARLRSPDPGGRARAFERLSKIPNAFRAPGMSTALVELVERENELDESVWRETRGTRSATARYGEGYDEYVGDVLDACSQYCDMSSPRAVVAYAEAIEPDNDWARDWAAQHATVLLPAMLDLARSGEFMQKRKAVQTLGGIAAGDRDLTENQRSAIDDALISALHDRSRFNVPWVALEEFGRILHANGRVSIARRTTVHDALVSVAQTGKLGERIAAIADLAQFRDPADRPLFQRLAKADTARSLSHGRVVHPVADAARKALGSIGP